MSLDWIVGLGDWLVPGKWELRSWPAPNFLAVTAPSASRLVPMLPAVSRFCFAASKALRAAFVGRAFSFVLSAEVKATPFTTASWVEVKLACLALRRVLSAAFVGKAANLLNCAAVISPLAEVVAAAMLLRTRSTKLVNTIFFLAPSQNMTESVLAIVSVAGVGSWFSAAVPVSWEKLEAPPVDGILSICEAS